MNAGDALRNGLLSFLSREWSGLAVAGAFAGAGAAIWLGSGQRRVGTTLVACGAALAVGATIHLRRIDAARRRFPPRGVLVDVGGYRMHVFAEGDAGARPSIVWLGGSHAAGAVMDHLHRQLRADTRSILIDRPGTGWSDTGPFPRTTAREAQEIVAALDAAGERGPYVVVGYSFGGLLAANIARRRPELVSTLVLLDATPLETIVFGPRLGSLADMRRDALGTALLRLAGFRVDLARRRLERRVQPGPAVSGFETLLGTALEELHGIEVGAGSQLANYSIYRELSPEGAAACAWETVVYDADLGDLPLVLVAPATAAEVDSVSEVRSAAEGESARMKRFFATSRERYLAASTRSRRVFTPAGTTHGYVYEKPDFVADVIRDVVMHAAAAHAG